MKTNLMKTYGFTPIKLFLVFSFIFLLSSSFVKAQPDNRYPDLMLTHIEVTSWDNYSVKISVINIGEKDSIPYTVKLDALSNGQYKEVDLINMPALLAGASASTTLIYNGKPDKKDLLLSSSMLKGTVDFNNSNNEKDENNNTLEVPISPPKVASDLIINNLLISSWKEPVMAVYTKNIGNGNANNFILKVEAFADNKWNFIGQWDIPSLESNGSKGYSVTYEDQPDKQALFVKASKLRAIVDLNNTVVEQDEFNNQLEIPLNPPKPDLIVQNLWIDESNGWKVFFPHIKVKNIGGMAIVDDFKVRLDYLPGPKIASSWHDLLKQTWSGSKYGAPGNPNLLKSGDEIDMGYIQYASLVPPVFFTAYKIKATVDYENTVVEANEGNNQLEAQVSPPKPDLVASSFEVLDWNQCLIKIILKNITPVSATATWFTNKIEAYSDKDKQWHEIEEFDNKATFVGTEMYSGQSSETIQLNFLKESNIKNLLLGSSKLKISIDTKNNIDEVNEGNNQLEIPINPPKPDLVINKIENDGRNSAVNLQILNKGDYEASNHYTIKIEVFSNNQWVEFDKLNVSLPLVAGGSFNISSNYKNIPDKKTLIGNAKRIKAAVDVYNTVLEKNEHNNEMTVPVN